MAYPIPKLSDADVPNTYVNRNKNFQFAQYATNTDYTELSAIECSEATIKNSTGQTLNIFDGSQYDRGSDTEIYQDYRAFALDSNESMVFRGITSTSQLSARTASGAGTFYVRTAFFSNSIST